MLRDEIGCHDVAFRNSSFSEIKDTAVYIEHAHKIMFFDCSFIENYEAAIYARRSKEITIANSYFKGNQHDPENVGTLPPTLSRAVVWAHEMHESGLTHNSFIMNLTNNECDLTGWFAGNWVPTFYMQQTWEGITDESSYSTVMEDETLIGGCEYDDSRFTYVYNNTVIADNSITAYYRYWCNLPGFHTLIQPYITIPDGSRTIDPDEPGTCLLYTSPSPRD